MSTHDGKTVEGPLSLCDLLGIGVAESPDGLALISADTRWTWRMLDDLSDRLAHGLLELGLKPGDRIASLMPNRPALVVHYIACFKAGLVATPLNYRYMGPEIDHALEISGARVLLAHVEREADLATCKLAGELPLGRIQFGGKGGSGPSFDDLIEGDRPPVRSNASLPFGSGRHLLHIWQHRTPQRSHPYARDARLDARHGDSCARAQLL